MYSVGEIIFPKRLTNCSASQGEHKELYAPLSKSKAKRIFRMREPDEHERNEKQTASQGDRLIGLLDPEVVIFLPLFLC